MRSCPGDPYLPFFLFAYGSIGVTFLWAHYSHRYRLRHNSQLLNSFSFSFNQMLIGMLQGLLLIYGNFILLYFVLFQFEIEHENELFFFLRRFSPKKWNKRGKLQLDRPFLGFSFDFVALEFCNFFYFCHFYFCCRGPLFWSKKSRLNHFSICFLFLISWNFCKSFFDF